jgi:hypothetical protein
MLKSSRLDSTGRFTQTNEAALEATNRISLRTAEYENKTLIQSDRILSNHVYLKL